MKYIALVGIWLVFALACVIGPVLVPLTLFIVPSYATRVFKTMNRMLAAVVGFEGDEGVSRECGKSDCRPCAYLCAILSFLLQEANHCDRENVRPS